VSPRVAVVVPVHDQAAFLGRALGSLLAQRLTDWEAVVVDDGSRDDPLSVVPRDPRLRTVRLDLNGGLGAALNCGIDATTAPFVAYLPADDAWDADHLQLLERALSDATLAWSGVRWLRGTTTGAPDDHCLQLVQVAHRRTGDRWVERDELESDDLERLLWSRLRAGGTASTGAVTCTWTDHPQQRSKAIRELHDGGLNVFRRRYGVRRPLRLHSPDSGLHDEVALYARFRERPPTPAAPDGLRILLVGELAFNPERVLALEERGHTLLGLWTDDALGAQTVGPLPFGHVTDVPDVDAARAARPDVVYGLLNWRAVPFAHAVRRALPELPFVWHFKEAPQACVRSGTWPQLVELCAQADALLLATDEERDWFDLALPGRLDPARTGVLDGDLPKADWFTSDRARRLRDVDGHVHTAVLGRPLGLAAQALVDLARADVHVHLHGQVNDRGPSAGWQTEVAAAQRAVPDRIHVHPKVDQRDWVHVLSRYDAGWLHRFRSANDGDLRRAVWDDLNAPARLSTYACAGLPMLQQRSPGCAVAAERIVGSAGVLYDDLDDLVDRLRDRPSLDAAGDACWSGRARFAFDTYADELVAVLRRAIERRSRQAGG
jgi:hypothetical protein